MPLQNWHNGKTANFFAIHAKKVRDFMNISLLHSIPLLKWVGLERMMLASLAYFMNYLFSIFIIIQRVAFFMTADTFFNCLQQKWFLTKKEQGIRSIETTMRFQIIAPWETDHDASLMINIFFARATISL